MTPAPDALLMLVVEASLGLAGFAGIVTVLDRRDRSDIRFSLSLNLVNLLATAFGALLLSFGALIALSANVSAQATWRIASAGGMSLSVFFGIRSVLLLAGDLGWERTRRAVLLYAVNLPLLALCFLQLWNILFWGEFWPFFALLVDLFAIGCFSFVRLLRTPED